MTSGCTYWYSGVRIPYYCYLQFWSYQVPTVTWILNIWQDSIHIYLPGFNCTLYICLASFVIRKRCVHDHTTAFFLYCFGHSSRTKILKMDSLQKVLKSQIKSTIQKCYHSIHNLIFCAFSLMTVIFPCRSSIYGEACIKQSTIGLNKTKWLRQGSTL